MSQPMKEVLKPVPDLAEIKKSLSILFEPDQVVELRALKTTNGTRSGYYSNYDEIAQDTFDLSANESVPNVYWTLQRLRPELLGERANCAVSHAEKTTKDQDVIAYRWLFLDFDPKREAGESTTDAEKKEAYHLTLIVRSYLSERGIHSILCDSGNGYHLLFRIDLPNEAQFVSLIQDLVKTFAHKFSTANVDMDTAVFNPARITKAYGSVARKGSHRPERPWRQSKILDAPAVEVVSEEKLHALLAEFGPTDGSERFSRPKLTINNNDRIPHGRHDNELARLAGEFRRIGMEEESMTAALTEAVEKRFDDYGTDYREMCAKVAHSICKKPVGEITTVLIGGREAGTGMVTTAEEGEKLLRDAKEREDAEIARIESLIDTRSTPRPKFPDWIMDGCSIYKNLALPVSQSSGKQKVLLFMPTFIGLMNYLSGRVWIKEEEVCLNQHLGLVSPAGDYHKSSSVEIAFNYLKASELLTFSKRNPGGQIIVIQGGSSEGMGKTLYKANAKNAIAFFDELSKCVGKATIQNATLAADFLTWAEQRFYENTIKSTNDSFSFEPKSYTFTWMWCTTEKGFPRQWGILTDKESGLADRTCIVLSDEKLKNGANSTVDYSGAVETKRLVDKAVKQGLYSYYDFDLVQKTLGNLNENKRSEARAKAFALAFATELDRSFVDEDCCERGAALSNYIFEVRKYMQPIEACTPQGRLMKEIVRELRRAGGKMTYRDLRRELDYLSYGDGWAKAYNLLLNNNEIAKWDARSPKNQKMHMVGLLKRDD